MSGKRLAILIPMTLLVVGNLRAEVFPGKRGFDPDGGYLTVKGTATGQFHLENIGGRHFLITPQGHGFLSIGVTHTGAISRPDPSEYDYLKGTCGGAWEKVDSDLLTHFRKWGFNSLGYDSYPSIRKRLPYFAGCQPTWVSVWRRQQIVYPDVFSDAWKQQARTVIQNTLKHYGVTPNLIGIYWTDVPAWDLKQQQRLLGKTWVDAIRSLPEDAPGRKRYEQFLRA